MAETVKTVSFAEKTLAEALIQQAYCVHEHLDWSDSHNLFNPDNICFALNNDENNYEGLLVLSQKTPGIFWVQFFYSIHSTNDQRLDDWRQLFSAAIETLQLKKALVAAIPTSNVFQALLINSQFRRFEEIIFLEANYTDFSPAVLTPPEAVTIHSLQPDDLPQIATLCEKAFPPLWRLSPENIRIATRQSDYTLVLKTDGEIIAYLLASQNQGAAHLARIAVTPALQLHGLGSFLLSSMFEYYIQLGITRFTVNTQSSNTSAITLYQKNGFYRTFDTYPVYSYGSQPYGLKKRQQPNNQRRNK